MAEKRASRGSAASAPARLREAQVLQLKLAGANSIEIGQALGVSPGRARSLVKRALDRIVREPADELIAAEDARLERLQRAWWPAAIGQVERVEDGRIVTAAREPDPKAALIILRISERRAKLHGMDAPTRTEHSGPDGAAIPVEVRAERLANNLRTLKERGDLSLVVDAKAEPS